MRSPVGPLRAAARSAAALTVAALTTALLGGCASTGDGSATRFPPASSGPSGPAAEPVPEKVPSPRSTFDYFVQNENCRCREYATSDRRHPVGYRFSASYRMQEGFITSIRITVENRSAADTLFLDPGAVRVASKNIEYQYNNRFLPLPDLVVLPGDAEEVELDGREVTSSPTWKRIAGEQMTLTIRGIRLGETVLAEQTVTFVPENPLLTGER